jgi:hypothetical protein
MAADFGFYHKKRWAYRQAFGKYIYYFANKPDAVLFNQISSTTIEKSHTGFAGQ